MVAKIMRLACFLPSSRWLGGMFLLAFCLAGCSKPEAPKTVDPRSAEGTLVQLMDQGRLLNEALARQDYTYLHDFGFRFKSLVQAFLGKLEEDQRQQMKEHLLQLLNIAGELDRASGGHRADATAATVQKLVAGLQETERLFRETKKGK